MKNKPFVIERFLQAPIEKVWNAITNKKDMKAWYFDVEEFVPEVGFEFSFYGETENEKYLHFCVITEVVEFKKLAYSWKYDGYKGLSHVTFELTPEGNGTKIKLTHSGLESFDVNKNPDLDSAKFGEGWSHIIGKSLVEFLET